MSMIISREGPRGCGYRKVGGIYLVCDGPGHVCEMLPLEMHSCPTCGQGIKPARGWTWINPAEMFKHEKCDKCDAKHDRLLLAAAEAAEQKAYPVADEILKAPRNEYCAFTKTEKAGLIWIGEQFYKTPGQFMREADEMGISRRITQVPRGFVVGETWVLLAHRKVDMYPKIARNVEQTSQAFVMVDNDDDYLRPAVFTAFLPSRIEKIVDENVTETEVRQIEESGMTPVQVVRLGETPGLFDSKEEDDDIQ